MADPHVGNRKAYGGAVVAGLNERGRLSVRTLQRALAKAKEEGATLFVIAGDLFDVRRPEPAVIVALQRLLSQFQDLPVLIVPGNHDLLDATAKDGNTACETLWQEATVVREPTWFPCGDFAVFAVPFQSEVPMADHLDEVLAAQAGVAPIPGARVCVTHVGVFDAKSPPWTRGAADGMEVGRLQAALAKGGFSECYVGNYHEHRAWSGPDGYWPKPGHVEQVGTLCPGGFGDEGYVHRGGLVLRSSAALGYVEIPGPRFLTLKAGEVPPKEVPEGVVLYVRTGDKKVLAAAPAAHVRAVDWSPPRVAEADQPPLPQAKDAGEALVEYVVQGTFADGVDKTRLLNLVQDLWKKAG